MSCDVYWFLQLLYFEKKYVLGSGALPYFRFKSIKLFVKKVYLFKFSNLLIDDQKKSNPIKKTEQIIEKLKLKIMKGTYVLC